MVMAEKLYEYGSFRETVPFWPETAVPVAELVTVNCAGVADATVTLVRLNVEVASPEMDTIAPADNEFAHVYVTVVPFAEAAVTVYEVVCVFSSTITCDWDNGVTVFTNWELMTWINCWTIALEVARLKPLKDSMCWTICCRFIVEFVGIEEPTNWASQGNA